MELLPLRSPKVVVVIPVKEINAYVRESVPHILKLRYPDFEILILPDVAGGSEGVANGNRVRVVPTGPMGPAEKRDMAPKLSEAEVLAFLDDDAFPEPDWLDHALPYFEDATVGAVGGPAVTPDHDNLWQKASGEVFATWLGNGIYSYRYIPQKRREVDDYPSVNFLIRRDVFEKVDGFDSTFWPGEDTKLCLEVTKRLNLRIIYDPRVFVWHHRRELFMPHLKQVCNYALHRGFFARVYPATSLRPSYFVPSVFALTFLAALAGLFTDSFVLKAPLWAMGFYLALLAGSIVSVSIRRRNAVLGLLAGAGIFATHFCYGVYFLKGLASRRLRR